MTKSRGIRSTRQKWSAKERNALARMYPNMPTTEVAAALGRSVNKIYQAVSRFGVERKSASYLASPAACRLRRGDNVGAAYRFPKGHVPANKGLRRPGWTRGRMAETQFKKGRPANEARNYLPIGTEKIDPKRNVLMRKVTDDQSIFPVKRWRPVHVMIWEAANGQAPPGHIIIFKRGMKTLLANEITLDRLELVTFAENMRRNSIQNLPAPLPALMQLRGKLNRKINRLERPHAKQD